MTSSVYGLKMKPQIPHEKLPTGTLLSDPVKGKFMALPLFGWVALRNKTKQPLVMMTVLLMRALDGATPTGAQDMKIRGTLNIEYPVYPDTFDAIVLMLEKFGWDGRIWPTEPGWPDGDVDAVAALGNLLEQAKLHASFTFPAAAFQEVSVERSTGPFLMPPLPTPETPVDPLKKERLQQLCADPSFFKLYRTKPVILM